MKTADEVQSRMPSRNGADEDFTLRLEHVSRHFGKVRAVDDLSLEVPQGSFVTLLGPSGCGESTTLNLIAGLERLDGGRIYLGQRDISMVPPNERRMAMVFQNYALYPHMTVAQNIGFSLKLQRRPKQEIGDRVGVVAEMLDIIPLLERKPGQLSGGQQQRVALGRALVKEPLVFLLDEPFSNLDAGLRARMRTEVKRLHVRLNTTSVFVTHDQEEAMTLSDLIAVMRDGKVVQYDTAKEIYQRPRNLYVATFVGKPRMSLVQGELTTEQDMLFFVAPGIRISLGPARVKKLSGAGGRAVVAGFRAEDVRVVRDGEPLDGLGFRAVVELIEPVGSDTFVDLTVDEARIVSRVPPDFSSSMGERVTVVVSPERVHLFDAETQDRIN